MTTQEMQKLIQVKKANGRPLFLHHRALDGKKNSNSVERAIATLGFSDLDGIEFDVQQTKDSEIIIRHDFTLDINNKYLWVKELSFATLRKYLAPKDCPTLEEFFIQIKGTNKILDIELKQPSIAKEVIALCKKYNLYNNVVFTTLYSEVYSELKILDDDVAIFFGYPRDRGKNLSNRSYMQPIIAIYIFILRNFIPYNLEKIYKLAENPFYTFYNKMMSKKLVANLHKGGKICGGAIMSLRNLDHAEETLHAMEDLIKMDADIVLTDYPESIGKLYE